MKSIFNFVLLLTAGLAVFVLGNPYYRVFPTNWNQSFYIGLFAFFLGAVVVCRFVPALSGYQAAAYAFLIASLALVVLKTGIFNLPESGSVSRRIALDKLSQFLHIVPVIVVMTLLSRKKLGEIFIQKGKLRQGLIFGLVSFIFFAMISFFIAASTSDLVKSLIVAAPWLLIFVFANATMEELWFRSIFLNNFYPLVGRWGAILITSLVFGISHINATYEFPGGGFVFGLVVFSLGVAGAYTMQKYDSLIGPVLFHAGYDLLIIVPIINSV
ncbi:MAG: CPBP family intramembrane metalloprotease [Anaerolineales bacterium]|nr:CPBP family intramembrane metalloprotease [Anaerolineales bacterium]